MTTVAIITMGFSLVSPQRLTDLGSLIPPAILMELAISFQYLPVIQSTTLKPMMSSQSQPGANLWPGIPPGTYLVLLKNRIPPVTGAGLLRFNTPVGMDPGTTPFLSTIIPPTLKPTCQLHWDNGRLTPSPTPKVTKP